MTIIFGLLLIVLGLLSAQEFIGEKIPGVKSTLDMLASYGEFIGTGGLLCGFIWFLEAAHLLGVIDIHPVLVITGFVASVLTMMLGLVFGLPLFHKFMNEPTPAILVKADKWSERLQPHRKILGFIAIAFAILGIFCGA
jgi:hypothetical protein